MLSHLISYSQRISYRTSNVLAAVTISSLMHYISSNRHTIDLPPTCATHRQSSTPIRICLSNILPCLRIVISSTYYHYPTHGLIILFSFTHSTHESHSHSLLSPPTNGSSSRFDTRTIPTNGSSSRFDTRTFITYCYH